MSLGIDHSRNKNSIKYAALASIYLMTGTNFIAVKVLSAELTPVALTTLRLLGAALLLLPFTIWQLRKKDQRPSGKQVGGTFTTGLLLFTIGQTGLAWGISTMPAGLSAVIGSSAPLFIVIFSAAFLKEAPPLRQIIGVLVGFAGIGALTWTAPDGELTLVGIVALLVSAAAWAAGSLYSRRAALPVGPIIALNLELLWGGLLTLPLTVMSTGAYPHVSSLSPTAWTSLAYLVLAAVIGFLAFNWLNKNTSSMLANTFLYVAPVIAIVLGAFFLGDAITLTKVLASAIALAGVVLIIR